MKSLSHYSLNTMGHQSDPKGIIINKTLYVRLDNKELHFYYGKYTITSHN